MKKLIALILALLLGLVSASSFFGSAHNVGGVEVVPPGEGTLDCTQDGYVITIESGEESAPVPSFICHNGFPAPAILSIEPAQLPPDLGVESIAPPSPLIPGLAVLPFKVVYNASGIILPPGAPSVTRTVVFEVSADVGFGQAVVISTFIVTVIVEAPPPLPSG